MSNNFLNRMFGDLIVRRGIFDASPVALTKIVFRWNWMSVDVFYVNKNEWFVENGDISIIKVVDSVSPMRVKLGGKL